MGAARCSKARTGAWRLLDCLVRALLIDCLVRARRPGVGLLPSNRPARQLAHGAPGVLQGAWRAGACGVSAMLCHVVWLERQLESTCVNLCQLVGCFLVRRALRRADGLTLGCSHARRHGRPSPSFRSWVLWLPRCSCVARSRPSGPCGVRARLGCRVGAVRYGSWQVSFAASSSAC